MSVLMKAGTSVSATIRKVSVVAAALVCGTAMIGQPSPASAQSGSAQSGAAQSGALTHYAVQPLPVQWTITNIRENDQDAARYVQYFANASLFRGAGPMPEQVSYEAYPIEQTDAAQVKALLDDGWTPVRYSVGSGAYGQRGSYGRAVVTGKTALFIVTANLHNMSRATMSKLFSSIVPPKTVGDQRFAVTAPRGLTRFFAGPIGRSSVNWSYLINTPNGRIGVLSIEGAETAFESRIIGATQRLTINGIAAVQHDRDVMWMATPTQFVQVYAADARTPQNDVLAVAQQLKPMSADAWRNYSNPPPVPTTTPPPSLDVVWGETDTLPWKISVQTRNGEPCYILTMGTRPVRDCLPTASTSPVPLSWGLFSIDNVYYHWVMAAPPVSTVVWSTSTSTAEYARVTLKSATPEGLRFGVVRTQIPGRGGPVPGPAVGLDASGAQVTSPVAETGVTGGFN